MPTEIFNFCVTYQNSAFCIFLYKFVEAVLKFLSVFSNFQSALDESKNAPFRQVPLFCYLFYLLLDPIVFLELSPKEARYPRKLVFQVLPFAHISRRLQSSKFLFSNQIDPHKVNSGYMVLDIYVDIIPTVSIEIYFRPVALLTKIQLVQPVFDCTVTVTDLNSICCALVM